MYFFGFWLCTWLLLVAVDSKLNPLALGIGAGSALAIMALVKLHAIFLVPGVALYLFMCSLFKLTEGGIRKFTQTALVMVVSFFALRLSLGYIIAGPSGLNIFGATYGGAAQSALPSAEALTNLFVHAVPFFIGHIMAILTIYTIPFLLMGTMRLHPVNSYEKKIASLQALTWSLLLPLVAVAALYTARVSQLDPVIEGANGHIRLHIRYYDFLFSLFAILAAAVASHSEHPEKFSNKRLLVAAIVSTIIACFVFDLAHYQLSLSDGPELRAFATVHGVMYFMLGVAFLSLVAWIGNPKLAAKIYILLFFPVFTFMGAAATYYSAHKELTPNIYHRAGIFAKARLKEDVSKLAIVGPNIAGVYQAMFYADNPNIAYYTGIPEYSCLIFSPAPNGKEWVLLVGEYKIKSDIDQNITMQDYSLVHTKPSTVKTDPCPAASK